MGCQSTREQFSSTRRSSFDNTLLVFHSTGSPHSKYLVHKILGQGAFGTVSLVEHKTTHQRRALKELIKSGLTYEDRSNIMTEIKILSTIDHPNIMKIYEVIESESAYNIVTEFIPGGELLELICKEKKLSEKISAKYMFELMSAIKYCHSLGVVHRDLKPQNLILTSNDDKGVIKVIDFGLAVNKGINAKYSDTVGTPLFMAPEVFSARYDEKCDIWSAGVIMFMMMTGLVPFAGNDRNQLRRSICTHQINFSKEKFSHISGQAKDLISKMLEKNPSRRFNAGDVLDHPWFHSYKENLLSENLLNVEAFESLAKFHAETKLKRTVLTFISTKIMDDEAVRELSRLFKAIDRNSDGKLSYDEITSAYEMLGVTLEDSKKVFAEIDSNQSGMVEYSEFITACQRVKVFENKGYLEKTFQTYDIGGDGTLSMAELKYSIPGIESQDWVEFFNKADKDKDGKISLSEFKEYLLSSEI